VKKHLLQVVVIAVVIVGGYYLSSMRDLKVVAQSEQAQESQSNLPYSGSGETPPEKPKSKSTTTSNTELSGREAPPKIQFLPTERRILGSSPVATIDVERSMGTLSSNDYYDKFNSLQEEQLNNPDATYLTDAYTDLINSNQEQADGFDVELSELTCGLKMCMGSAIADSATWGKFVMNYLGSQLPGESAFGAMTTYPYRIDENTLSNRFMFSVDPDASAVTVQPLESGQSMYWVREDETGSDSGGGDEGDSSGNNEGDGG